MVRDVDPKGLEGRNAANHLYKQDLDKKMCCRVCRNVSAPREEFRG